MMDRRADQGFLEAVTIATCSAIRKAMIYLPGDEYRAISRAAVLEQGDIARGEFANILANIENSRWLLASMPMAGTTLKK